MYRLSYCMAKFCNLFVGTDTLWTIQPLQGEGPSVQSLTKRSKFEQTLQAFFSRVEIFGQVKIAGLVHAMHARVYL
jgi:hypothetical protein